MQELMSRKSQLLKEFAHLVLVLSFFCIVYTLFFSPALYSGRLLAPGDAIIHSVPAFYSHPTLWTDLVLSGFPAASDPTIQTWYPIHILFSNIFKSWNAYVISAYVLASSFTYGYVYTLTTSRLASVVGGLIYGMSGFMMAHLGHTMIIHAAAWLPLMVWSLEKLRYKFDSAWFFCDCLAMSCSILAGHPQITAYSLAVSCSYYLVMEWKVLIRGVLAPLRILLGSILLSLGIASIQILPTAQLASLGTRVDFSFQEFNSYSLPLRESIQFLFPYLFGGGFSLYQTPYFGTWGLTETTGYVGLTTLILAAITVVLTFRNLLPPQYKAISVFWICVSLAGLLLVLGEATPLSLLVYHLPILNKFRVPSRHFVELSLSFSVLASLGILYIQKHLVSKPLLNKLTIYSITIFLLIISAIFLFQDSLLNFARKSLNEEFLQGLNFLPLYNSALLIPLLIFVVSITFLNLFIRLPSSRVFHLLLCLLMFIDLGSFGWFYEWQYASPNATDLEPNFYVRKYAQILSSNNQRILPLNGGLGSFDEIPGNNISRLWGVPNASGYGPMMLSRVGSLLSMSTSGTVDKKVLYQNDKSLDIMSVRYITVDDHLESKSNIHDVNWSKKDMGLILGNDCGVISSSNSVEFKSLSFDFLQHITDLAIVSSLSCSTSVTNNLEVLTVTVTDKSGNSTTQDFLAGADTSEWAYDCPDVLSIVQHDKARIFDSFSQSAHSSCQGHSYYSILPIDQNLNDGIDSIKLTWLGSSGVINIQKLSLLNRLTGESYPLLAEQDALGNPDRWSYSEDIGKAIIYENLRAMPRAWLVSDVKHLTPEQILTSIKSSSLPDGSYYDSRKVALIEENLDLNLSSELTDLNADVEIERVSNTNIQIKTSSIFPTFLVLSDVNYPGWKATVDAKTTHIFQTNYVSRGVFLSEGDHIVSFKFEPQVFHIGLGITLGSLLLISYFLIKSMKLCKAE